MPDAIITSTASTFGTISGTFAADQSTITGTVSGIITGTLSGSVGVPGPAGSPGAPGVGVPAGGTAGQYLQKIDGVDYNTDWVTLNLSGYALLSGADFTGRVTVPGSTGDEFARVPGFNIVPTQTEPTDKVDGDLWVYDDEGDTPSKFRVFLAGSTYNVATESWVSSLYAPIVSPVFTGNPRAPTPATSDNDTSIATTAFVKVQGYLTSAPVTSVAGRTGAITLSNTDISGLGSLAVVNDAPSNGSQYARKNAAWDVIISGDRYLTSSTTSNTVSNGNKTFTIGTGLSYTPTQNITISYDASNHMHGEVLTYNSGTGVLTVDINHHTGSGTYAAWVVNVGGVTPATSVAFADITGAVSSNANLQAALDLKANLASPTFTGTPLSTTAAVDTNTTQIATTAYVVGQGYLKSATASSTYAPLASPTFTGTPSLPTGTTAVTQTAGNNTTAVATTAFVTAAVPALATLTDSRQLTNDTKAMSPTDVLWSLMTQDYIDIDRINFTYTTTGTPQQNFVGSITTKSRLNATVVSSVIGRPFGTSQIDQVSPFLFRNNWSSNINFNLKTYLSGRAGSFSLLTDAAFNQAFYYGKVEGDAIGDLTRRGFGWRWTGGAGSRFVNLVVHNGTTQTTVASSFAVTSEVAFDWDLYSDGAGNVTLYINGSQVATSNLGPTSYQSAGTYAWWREETWTTAAPSFGNHTSYFRGGRAAILNY